jgi:hypothetical protein
MDIQGSKRPSARSLPNFKGNWTVPITGGLEDHVEIHCEPTSVLSEEQPGTRESPTSMKRFTAASEGMRTESIAVRIGNVNQCGHRR